MRVRGLAVLGTVALGLVASSSLVSGVEDAALDRVAADWAGSYDILVLPGDGGAAAATDLTDASGLALVDPNFANVTSTTIDDALVEEVRSVEGVGLAAPVGFLGRTDSEMEWPMVHVPESVLHEQPLMSLRLVATTVLDDGLGEHVAQHTDYTFLIDAREFTQSGDLQGVETVGSRQFDGGDRVVDGVVSLSLLPLPAASSTVFAVDPVAEMALLGEDADFLEPLARFDAALEEHEGSLTVSEYEDLPSDDAVRGLVEELPEQAVQAGLVHGMYGFDNPIAPFVRASDSLPPHELTVEFFEGEPPPAATAAELAQLDDESFTPMGETVQDLTDLRVPFAGTSIAVPWPGEDAGPPNYFPNAPGVSSIAPLSLAESDRRAPSPHRPAVETERTYVLNASRDQQVPHQHLGTGVALGQTSAYRETTEQDRPRIGLRYDVLEDGSESDGAVPIEVGQYTAGSVVPTADEPGYVPVGAYDPALAEVADNPLTDEEGDRVSLAPTLTGLGVSAQPAGAITTMAGAEAFGMPEPTTAIRVRVEGVEEYSAESLARVEEVARQIEDLGLTAHMVAGASPQDVQVYVPDYAFGTSDPEGMQEVADLGWVDLSFTTLGAGPAAHDALGSSSSTLAVVTIAVLVGAASVAIIAAHPARVADSRVLRRNGFTTGWRATWFASGYAPGLALVLLAAAAAAILAPTARLSGVSIAVPVALAAVVAVTSVAAARASDTARARTNRPAARADRLESAASTPLRRMSSGRLAIRSVRGRWAPALVESGGVALMAVTGGAAVAVVLDVRARVAVTAIGEQAAIATSVLSAALLLLCAVGGLITLLAGARLDAPSRNHRARVLRRVAGATDRQLLRLELWQAIPGAAFTALLTAGSYPLVVSLVQDDARGPQFAFAAGLVALITITSLAVLRARAGRMSHR